MHWADLFIANGADLKYTKNKLFKFPGESCCILKRIDRLTSELK